MDEAPVLVPPPRVGPLRTEPGYYGVPDARAAELHGMDFTAACQLTKTRDFRFWWLVVARREWDATAVRLNDKRVAALREAKAPFAMPPEPLATMTPLAPVYAPAIVAVAPATVPVAAPSAAPVIETAPAVTIMSDAEIDNDVSVYTPPHLAAALALPAAEEPAELVTSWDARPKHRSPIRADRPASASPRKRGRPAKPKA